MTRAKIKKNAVTASKIKNNSISTSKVANGAITGAKVNLSSLGTVPSANSANIANTANCLSGQTAVKLFKTLTEGQTNVTVGTVAGFTITASCETNNANVTIAGPTGPGFVIESGGVPGSGENKTTEDYEGTKPGEAGDIEVDASPTWQKRHLWSFFGLLGDPRRKRVRRRDRLRLRHVQQHSGEYLHRLRAPARGLIVRQSS